MPPNSTAEQSLQLARQYERVIDRFLICEVFLARLKLAQGDVDGAAAILAEASHPRASKTLCIASLKLLPHKC